jgi:flagellar basal-body rod protein FlgG
MLAQQTNIDVISNNLANVNTTGFKKSRADFQSLLYQALRRPVATEGFFNPTGIEVGNGVRIVGTLKDYSGGMLQETGNDLDIAIEGKGFLMVELPDGTVGYTKDGALRIDSAGYLVNASGYYVLSSKGNQAISGGNITVGGKTMKRILPDTVDNIINIAENGIISTEKVPGTNSSAPVIELANFVNPAALEAKGANIYTANEVAGKVTIDAPLKAGLGSLQSGFLESSNVKIVEEMVKLIIAQRAYEINSKSIQTSDELLGMTNNLRR